MRHSGGAPAFSGQLLFAELGNRSIVLDFLLAPDGDGSPGAPVTVKAVWPARSRVHRVTALLKEWASLDAPVEVTIHEGVRGPTVAIESRSTRVVLVSDD